MSSASSSNNLLLSLTQLRFAYYKFSLLAKLNNWSYILFYSLLAKKKVKQPKESGFVGYIN